MSREKMILIWSFLVLCFERSTLLASEDQGTRHMWNCLWLPIYLLCAWEREISMKVPKVTMGALVIWIFQWYESGWIWVLSLQCNSSKTLKYIWTWRFENSSKEKMDAPLMKSTRSFRLKFMFCEIVVSVCQISELAKRLNSALGRFSVINRGNTRPILVHKLLDCATGVIAM